jgi:hypothetical protein
MMVGKIQGGRLGGHGQGTQDVTLSSKGRVIWDAKPINEFCDKGRHPPALQPKHDEVARLMAWWQTRYPNTPTLIPKRTCRTLSSGSQSGKGHSPVRCRSPRRRVRGPGRNITVLYNSLTFEWTGAPGECMLFASLIKLGHSMFHLRNLGGTTPWLSGLLSSWMMLS